MVTPLCTPTELCIKAASVLRGRKVESKLLDTFKEAIIRTIHMATTE
jgi:hypothetical protein